MCEYYDNDFAWEEHKSIVQEQCDAVPILSSSDKELEQETPIHAHKWKEFYLNHNTLKFFKQKRYLPRAFPTLWVLRNNLSKQQKSLIFEIGCGYGSAAIPILRALRGVRYYGTDVSNVAVEGFKNNANANGIGSDRYEVHISDATFEKLEVPGNTVDFVLLSFTLSAIPCEKHALVLAEAYRILKKDGIILFRDYGLYDMVQTRCKTRLGETQYIKQDGILCYFFSLKYTEALFSSMGFQKITQKYCTVINSNRKTKQTMRRVFINAEYKK